VASALVHTEWKRVHGTSGQKRKRRREEANKVVRKVADAKRQVEAYQAGILAGVELEQLSYIIVVSEFSLPGFPDAQQIANRRCKLLNIALDPDVPSKRKA
jgi:hypothetical protein